LASSVFDLFSRKGDHAISDLHQDSPRSIELVRSTRHALIDQFRDLLRRRHGAIAVEVLDHCLNGGETRELVEQPGLETSYRLKQVVQTIKQAAQELPMATKHF
jgi:hypothetical protein